MFSIPKALGEQFVAAYSQFHDPATANAVRNGVVTDFLELVREHDPNTSIWDVLFVFDRQRHAA